jgi:hypothetical protein
MKKTVQCATWISRRFVPQIIFNLPGINLICARSGRLNKLKLMKNDNKTRSPKLIQAGIMNQLFKLTANRFALALAVAAGLAASTVSSQAQGAVATISGVAAGGGVFDYTITLYNTGTTSLDSFWYAWTQSGNNLSAAITTPGSSLGWTDAALEGNTSISWEGNSGDALAVGQSATFTFDSTETPSAITTSPSGESVVYVNGTGPNTFGQNSPGSASPVFSPTLVPAPEPSTMGLVAAGALVLAVVRKLCRPQITAS